MSLKENIDRIKKMEEIFDILQNVMVQNPKSISEDASIKAKMQILVEYYENGQWMLDYESDERGELPKDLKRGVLSEDGVYNFLTELNFI